MKGPFLHLILFLCAFKLFSQQVQNSSYNTIGYIKQDGAVQNSSYNTIGYIKQDGTVQNSSYNTIGYAKNINPNWAAAAIFFFFYRLN